MPRKIVTYFLLLFVSVMILIPFAYLTCSSLKSPEDFFTSLFLPAGDGPFGIAWNHLTLDNFQRVLSQPSFPPLLNSFFFSSVTATLATLSCAMATCRSPATTSPAADSSAPSSSPPRHPSSRPPPLPRLPASLPPATPRHRLGLHPSLRRSRLRRLPVPASTCSPPSPPSSSKQPARRLFRVPHLLHHRPPRPPDDRCLPPPHFSRHLE